MEAHPQTFGRFSIDSVLGEGASGTVYRAVDPSLNRTVALKVMRSGVLDDAARTDRFLRDVRTAGTVVHPNLCPVFDAGEIDGTFYVTMAEVPGHPLSEYVQPGEQVSKRHAARLVRKLALALEAVHRKGIVHGNLKPSNVLIDRERHEPVVTDFGLPLPDAAASDDEQARQRMLLYAAPELVRDETARQPAADIYSLGVVLYELICARAPFEDSQKSASSAERVDPQPPSACRPDVEPELDAVCMKALSAEVSARYASMGELAEALSEYLRGREGGDAESTGKHDDSSGSAEERRSAAERFAHDTGDVQLAALFAEQKAADTGKSADSILIGNRVRCLDYRDTVQGGSGSVARALSSALPFLKGRSGRVRARVNDPTATVQIDGKTLDLKANEPLCLDAGRHRLEVQRGHVTELTEHFEVKRGDDLLLEITLEELSAAERHVQREIGKEADESAPIDAGQTGLRRAGIEPPRRERKPEPARTPQEPPPEPPRTEKQKEKKSPEPESERRTTPQPETPPQPEPEPPRRDEPPSESRTKRESRPARKPEPAPKRKPAPQPPQRKKREPESRPKREPPSQPAESSGPAAEKPRKDDRHKRAAQWVLEIGGTLTVHADGRSRVVKRPDDLPEAIDRIPAINLSRNSQVDDDGLSRLQGLESVTRLALAGTRVTDRGLEHLAGLATLQVLHLGGTSITDRGLAQLRKLGNLQVLYLSRTRTTDEGLAHLQSLQNLTGLYLDETAATDAGLDRLRKLQQLAYLTLKGTRVTEPAVQKLRAALPECEIVA